MNNMLLLVNVAFLESQPRRNPKDNFSQTWPTVCDWETIPIKGTAVIGVVHHKIVASKNVGSKNVTENCTWQIVIGLSVFTGRLKINSSLNLRQNHKK